MASGKASSVRGKNARLALLGSSHHCRKHAGLVLLLRSEFSSQQLNQQAKSTIRTDRLLSTISRQTLSADLLRLLRVLVMFDESIGAKSVHYH